MRALDLVRQRLADVVQEGRALRGLHARLQLGGHDPGEVDDLERVLEDVLPVARPEPEAAEDLDQPLVDVAAVGLEDGLLAGLLDDLFDLRLRLVVHLLDPRRMDAAVLDQLRQRQLRDLAPDPVEGREHDRLRGVVDDHVDPGEVLEGPNVAALAADDPALHVVGRQLDQGDRGLGCVIRGHALESVGDEVPRAPLGLAPRLLLGLAHVARELVPDQLLRALEQVRLRLVDGHARDPLQLGLLDVACALELFLELLRVQLPVGDPLFAPRQLGQLAVDLVFLREYALFDLQRLGPSGRDFLLDFGPEPDGLLPRLDLRFSAERVGVSTRLGDQELARAARRGESRAGQRVERQEGEARSYCQADHYPDDDEHARSLLDAGRVPGWGPVVRVETRCSLGTAARTCSNRARGSAGLAASGHVTAGRSSPPLRSSGSWSWFSKLGGSDSETRKLQAKCRTEPSHPSADYASGAMGSAAARSTASRSKPRPARRRAVFGPVPRLETMRSARSRSGSSSASAASTSSSPSPCVRRSKRMARSPFPRSARAFARLPAKRSSSSRPTLRSSVSASSSSVSSMPARLRRLCRPRRGHPRRPRGRVAAASASPIYVFEATSSASTAASADSFAVFPFGDLPFGGFPLASASSSGRRRAETTWSGPASAWMRVRICWPTSGCSRRKAVAFWRPWPSRSSSKLKYEPDFWTTFRSSAASRTVPSQEIPVP